MVTPLYKFEGCPQRIALNFQCALYRHTVGLGLVPYQSQTYPCNFTKGTVCLGPIPQIGVCIENQTKLRTLKPLGASQFVVAVIQFRAHPRPSCPTSRRPGTSHSSLHASRCTASSETAAVASSSTSASSSARRGTVTSVEGGLRRLTPVSVYCIAAASHARSTM